MNEADLISHLQQDVDATLGGGYSEVSEQRAEAMEYYLGEPYGNEIDGRSQVVTSEVSNAIEWIKPQLLKIFTSTNKIVEFEPDGPDDEAAANQETTYLNHVFFKDNDGFQILYTWFQDALLQKNGVLKYFWEETEEIAKEDYEGLNELQYMALASEEDIEITGYEEILTEEGMFYNCNVDRKIKNGKISILNVPPEDFLVHDNHNSICLNDVYFCAHKSEKTKEQLIDEGYPKKLVEELSFDAGTDISEDESRFNDIDSSSSNIGSSKKTATIYECYKRVDFDGDGYAELRKVTYSGETLLDNEIIDYIPFVAITPVILSHRYYGRSLADLIKDLQLIKSTLLRNILDNLYHINNQRTVAVDGEVNIDDLLDNRIGGVVRVTAPGMIEPFPIVPFSGHAFQMLEYLDSLGENRSGVTRYSQGLDADSLNKTATGVTKIMSASQERVLLIARIFANGLRNLFLGLHRVLQQNQDFYRKVRLNDQWVPINPSEWKTRENMSINVGLGSGDKTEEINALNMILQYQKEILASGESTYVTPKHIYRTLTKLVEAAGFKDANQFFADPATVPPAPKQPGIEEQMIQLQGQIEQQKAQIDQYEAQIKAFEAQVEAQYKQRDLELREMEITGKYIKDRNQEELGQKRLDLSEYQTDVKAATEMEKIENVSSNQQ